ncbi:MAG: ATPase [uncultured Sulfurovum sp.]|uniref:ATPase n=1 Tax=uncultured Sulfurovum sp. TaxID=269237 RepID=A0A6S6SXX0_9BACT|nr:MAG: ATPase [uncultured Sulfurovum sp.]
MLKRTIENQIKDALKISPVVLIAGARQIGKSTLVSTLDRKYLVMDDITQLDAAINDPQGYVDRVIKPVTIDEIQKVPQLLTPIKLFVDKKRINGQFLLTGSANVLNLNKANDSLAGRLIELTMYPFTAKERNKDPHSNIVDILFSIPTELLDYNKKNASKVSQYILEGSYPLATQMPRHKDRFMWINSYISTYIERDVRAIGELRDIDNFIRFFNILAPRSANILNKSDIANDAKLTNVTVDNYLSLLEKVYQIHLLRPYFENIGKSFIKSPKVYLTDSGINSHVLNIGSADELESSRYKGDVYETFVFAELLKHINYSESVMEFFYYRTSDKKEIDFIVKKGEKILAIEVKSSKSVKKEDFKHIIDFQERSSRDILGIVFYSGEDIVGFSEKLFAVPLAFLL